MEIKEIKEKTKEELKKLLSENREKLRDLEFKIVSKQFKNVRDIRKIKKAIAKILTILQEKK